MSISLEIILIACLTAAACALPGGFLVSRGMAMLSDSITHTALLGIVLAYYATRDLASPLLMLGAAAIGVATVWCTQGLCRTGLVREDASIGIVYALLFSIAIILIARGADTVHLDTDSVLLGELAFAPFDRLVVCGRDWGAKAVYLSGGMLLVNIAFISVFYKELTLMSFDPTLARILGFRPQRMHYALMSVVSLTAVTAFEAVGSILVVAFMIGPALTARLLTDRLGRMLALSCLIACMGACAGYGLASALDVSIAGMMAVVVGALFLIAFLCARNKE